MIIGLLGKKQTGKDLTGKIIKQIIFEELYKEDIKNTKLNLYQLYSDFNSSNENWHIKKFADKLKQILCILTGCTMEQLEDEEFKKSYLPIEWDKWTFTILEDLKTKPVIKRFTYREVLQYTGTDLFRDKFHKDVWVNALFADYKEQIVELPSVGDKLNRGYPNWIITDVRFPNEVDRIKKEDGMVIKLIRDTNLIDIHGSEKSVDLCPYDYLIDNNSSIKQLIDTIKPIILKYILL